MMGHKCIKILAILLLCALLGGCAKAPMAPKEEQAQGQEEMAPQKEKIAVDLLKISPMIEGNAEKEVIDAALAVIRAFLNYENSAKITIHGNKARFLNDMGYIINSTCPLFSAFTDYNETTAYDEAQGALCWNFFISKQELQEKLEAFTQRMEEYLSQIDQGDTDAMKAILLYREMIRDAAYDEGILGNAYAEMEAAEYHLRNSSYFALMNKKGICTNLSQGLMFLYTQAGLESGTVLHQGGSGAHMWVVMKIDGQYYYCDPTWDAGASLQTFGITAEDRGSWAGGYAKGEGKMLATIVDQKYEITDGRFAELREKVPVEITNLRVDKGEQTITFEGYDYEYCFSCRK